ncbi:MAG TPA: fluoride efflux transporter CrcB [Acidimicrobiales bacterium]|nr:fluoride efflux transporter CrcB [Acidimicrobiales bacterium]
MRAVAVGLAGFFGAVSRYWLDGLVSRATSGAFPWGTFVVNVSGCFAIGFLTTLLTGKILPHPVLRTAILVGFIGAYTTFSTYVWESLQLARGGALLIAAANVVASVAAGLGAAWLGMSLAGAA